VLGRVIVSSSSSPSLALSLLSSVGLNRESDEIDVLVPFLRFPTDLPLPSSAADSSLP
jgi:hypothetical protein